MVLWPGTQSIVKKTRTSDWLKLHGWLHKIFNVTLFITSAPNGNMINIPWIIVLRLENVQVDFSFLSLSAGTFYHPDKSEFIWNKPKDPLFSRKFMPLFPWVFETTSGYESQVNARGILEKLFSKCLVVKLRKDVHRDGLSKSWLCCSFHGNIHFITTTHFFSWNFLQADHCHEFGNMIHQIVQRHCWPCS